MVTSVDSFEAFLEENFDPIRRALVLALGDPARAEELAQEAFARAYARWSTVSVMQRPVAWIYVVAMNKARRDLRREARDHGAMVEPVSDDPSGQVATAVTVRAALATLAPRQRAVVVLRCLADLSTRETATALKCSPGTVKATLHAAFAHLRVEMEEDVPE